MDRSGSFCQCGTRHTNGIRHVDEGGTGREWILLLVWFQRPCGRRLYWSGVGTTVGVAPETRQSPCGRRGYWSRVNHEGHSPVAQRDQTWACVVV